MLSKGVPKWFAFRYERLPNYCFWCGGFDHTERDCVVAFEDDAKEGDRRVFRDLKVNDTRNNFTRVANSSRWVDGGGEGVFGPRFVHRSSRNLSEWGSGQNEDRGDIVGEGLAATLHGLQLREERCEVGSPSLQGAQREGAGMYMEKASEVGGGKQSGLDGITRDHDEMGMARVNEGWGGTVSAFSGEVLDNMGRNEVVREHAEYGVQMREELLPKGQLHVEFSPNVGGFTEVGEGVSPRVEALADVVDGSGVDELPSVNLNLNLEADGGGNGVARLESKKWKRRPRSTVLSPDEVGTNQVGAKRQSLMLLCDDVQEVVKKPKQVDAIILALPTASPGSQGRREQ